MKVVLLVTGIWTALTVLFWAFGGVQPNMLDALMAVLLLVAFVHEVIES